jgi:anti-sigma B factor antagonist
MQISERRAGDVTIFDLDGRLILDEGFEPLREKLNQAIGNGDMKVLLNFDRVSYLDSAGIGLIACKYVTMKRLGGELKLCNLHPRAYNVLNITRLLTIFESFTTEQDALAKFSGIQN